MRKTMSVWFFVVVAVLLGIGFAYLVSDQNLRISQLESDNESAQLTLLGEMETNSERTTTLKKTSSESYVIDVARKNYQYVYDNEICLTVSNPEELYGGPIPEEFLTDADRS